MSSYYTTAQLEAMRKERLKKELQDSLNKLKSQISTHSKNESIVSVSRGVTISTTDQDLGVSGYSVQGKIITEEYTSDIKGRDIIDFSALLECENKTKSALEQQFDKLVERINNRAILTEKDEQDKNRILREIHKIKTSQSMSLEDKLTITERMVLAYLQCGKLISQIDMEQLKSQYYDYLALCEMADTKPVEMLPERIEKEITRLMNVLERRKQNEYIMDTLTSIMEQLGCHMKKESILDHISGVVFSVEGQPLCDVFMGADQSGILFEPIVESREGSLDKKRQIQRSANYICSMYNDLEEFAAEKGIVLRRVYMEPVDIENICVNSDIKEVKKQHRSKKDYLFEKEMGTEA